MPKRAFEMDLHPSKDFLESSSDSSSSSDSEDSIPSDLDVNDLGDRLDEYVEEGDEEEGEEKGKKSIDSLPSTVSSLQALSLGADGERGIKELEGDLKKSKEAKSKKSSSMTRLQEADLLLRVYDALAAYRRPSQHPSLMRKVNAIDQASELLNTLRLHLKKQEEEEKTEEEEKKMKIVKTTPPAKDKTAKPKTDKLPKLSKQEKASTPEKTPKNAFQLFAKEKTQEIKSTSSTTSNDGKKVNQPSLTSAAPRSRVAALWASLGEAETEIWTSKYLVQFGGLYDKSHPSIAQNPLLHHEKDSKSSVASQLSSSLTPHSKMCLSLAPIHSSSVTDLTKPPTDSFIWKVSVNPRISGTSNVLLERIKSTHLMASLQGSTASQPSALVPMTSSTGSLPAQTALTLLPIPASLVPPSTLLSASSTFTSSFCAIAANANLLALNDGLQTLIFEILPSLASTLPASDKGQSLKEMMLLPNHYSHTGGTGSSGVPISSIHVSLAFSSSGAHLFVSESSTPGSADQRPACIRKWNLETGSVEGEAWGGPGSISSISLSHDGSLLAWASDDKHINLVDTSTMTLRRRYGSNGEKRFLVSKFVSVALSPSGAYLAAGDVEGVIRMWSNLDGSLLSRCDGHESVITSLICSEEKMVISASIDGQIRYWDANTISDGHLYALTKAPVLSLGLDARNSLLFAGGKDSLLRAFPAPLPGHGADMMTVDPYFIAIGHKGGVVDVKVAEKEVNVSVVFSLSSEGTLAIWKI